MRVAACQMNAGLAKVPENTARAERLLDEAFARGATWAVLPEFFPSAISFRALQVHPKLLRLRSSNGYGPFVFACRSAMWRSSWLSRAAADFANHVATHAVDIASGQTG